MHILFIEIVFFEPILVKDLFEVVITAIMDRSQSFSILFDLASTFNQKHDNIPMPVLSCKMQGGISITIESIDLDKIVNQYFDDIVMSS